MIKLHDNLIEQVAQAIWGADENAHERFWDDVSERWRNHYRNLAKCAAYKTLSIINSQKESETWVPNDH